MCYIYLHFTYLHTCLLTYLQESKVLPSEEAVCRAGLNLPQLAKAATEHPFHGLLASQLKCKRCGYQVPHCLSHSVFT